MKSVLKAYTWNRIKHFLYRFIQLKIEHHQVIRKKAKEKVVEPICGKIKLPKESIKTQKVTNAPKLITQ